MDGFIHLCTDIERINFRSAIDKSDEILQIRILLDQLAKRRLTDESISQSGHGTHAQTPF